MTTTGNGYTKTDNWLWDYVMPRAKPNTFKVVAAVMRMTAGWHQDEAAITFDDFHELTGITSRGTLSRAIDDALSEGFISRKVDGRTFVYSLKIVPMNSTEMRPVDDAAVSKSYHKQSQNRTADSLKTVPPHSSTINKRKETKEKERDAHAGEDAPNGFWALPENLNSADFIRAWNRWLSYVDERGLDFTETQAELTLRELSECGESVATRSVINSIRKGWRNIYVSGDMARASPVGVNGHLTPVYQANELGEY